MSILLFILSGGVFAFGVLILNQSSSAIQEIVGMLALVGAVLLFVGGCTILVVNQAVKEFHERMDDVEIQLAGKRKARNGKYGQTQSR